MCEEAEDIDTERVAITARVPAYQKEEWVKEADKLDMSQSEYLRTMVQAGRHDLGIAENFGSVTDGEDSRDSDQEGRINDSQHQDTSTGPFSLRSGRLQPYLLKQIERENVLSFNDLVTTIAGDIEEQVDDALADLQSSDRVRYNGREGGYTMVEQ